MNDIIKDIIAIEWDMFHNVNGETRECCQEDKDTFVLMRNAQFSEWNEAACLSYLKDVQAAAAQGKSLVREKYIHMMKKTDPSGYDAFKNELPEISNEKSELTESIWQHMLVQTEKVREKYPLLALGGRPLHTYEEKEWPSVETYQKSELLTYSEDTLKLLLDHIENLEKDGINMVWKIQENSVLCLGYKTMDDAEIAMAGQIMEEFGMTAEMSDCPACSVGTEIYSEQNPDLFQL